MTSRRAGRYSTKLVAYGAESLDGAVQFVSLVVQPLAINVRLALRVQHGDEIVQRKLGRLAERNQGQSLEYIGTKHATQAPTTYRTDKAFLFVVAQR